MKRGFARYAIVLGLLSAMGPFAIDMYLPALPTIAADLGTTIAATQASLMAFFLAVGLCQIVYGPVSDKVGRRGPLYFGLVLFVVGSIGCYLSPNIETLIGFRIIQGVGACAGIVISRAIVRDLHTGPDAARMMALIMLVFSVSPILAPITGSALIVVSGWRAIFAAISLVGLLGIALVTYALPETWPEARRSKVSLRSTLRDYGKLLHDRRFLGIVFIGGFGLSCFYIFLATSSFVFVEHFGLTPVQYSVIFSLNAIGFIGMAQFSSALARRFGFDGVVRAAAACLAATTLVLFLLTVGGVDRVPVVIVFLIVAYTCLGLILPTTVVMALEPYGPMAGTAVAMMGTIHMVLGAVCMALVSLVFDGSSLVMVAAIAISAGLAFAASRLTLSPRA